jgi:hypothetical protein
MPASPTSASSLPALPAMPLPIKKEELMCDDSMEASSTSTISGGGNDVAMASSPGGEDMRIERKDGNANVPALLQVSQSNDNKTKVP